MGLRMDQLLIALGPFAGFFIAVWAVMGFLAPFFLFGVWRQAKLSAETLEKLLAVQRSALQIIDPDKERYKDQTSDPDGAVRHHY